MDALGLGAIYVHGMLDDNGVLGHGGQTLGFQSDGGYVPDKDVTIVMWSNAAESNVSRSIVPGIAALVLGDEQAGGRLRPPQPPRTSRWTSASPYRRKTSRSIST